MSRCASGMTEHHHPTPTLQSHAQLHPACRSSRSLQLLMVNPELLLLLLLMSCYQQSDQTKPADSGQVQILPLHALLSGERSSET